MAEDATEDRGGEASPPRLLMGWGLWEHELPEGPSPALVGGRTSGQESGSGGDASAGQMSEEPVPSPAEGLPRGGNSREQAWKQPNTLKSPSTESVKHGSQSPSPAEGGKRAGRQGGVGSAATRHCRASQHHVQEVSQSQGLVTLFLKVRKLQIRMCSLRLVRPSTKLRRTPLRRIWL